MKSTLTLICLSVVLLAGCGEPKTYKMNRMHAVNPMGSFFVQGSVQGIDQSPTKLTIGETVYSNLTLQDETGHYTFYFLPSAHPRQPVTGDKVKMEVKFEVLDQSFAGGGRVPIIRKLEFQ